MDDGRYEAAKLHEGVHPIPRAARFRREGELLSVLVDDAAAAYPVAEVRVSPRIGRADRFILLPDGRQLQCADGPSLDGLPEEVSSEGAPAWLEQRWWVALASLFAVVAGVIGFHQRLLPVVGDLAIGGISASQEHVMGAQALRILEIQKMLQPSQIPHEAQAQVLSGFADLTDLLPSGRRYKLEFRSAPALGPNALALPGGIIIVTDQLFDRCLTDEAVAVLAHEVGHAEKRHALRLMFRSTVTAAMFGFLSADAAGLMLSASALPALLVSSQFSREFEAEADTFAFDLLERHGQSPELFARCLERLAAQAHEGKDEWRFLSSHPGSAERINEARARAGSAASRAHGDQPGK